MLSPKQDPDDTVLAITQGWEALIDHMVGAVVDRLCERLSPMPVVTGDRLPYHAVGNTGNAYDEPGPAGVRKWFERDELYKRWGVKKSKLQDLEHLGSLPAWRPGPQKVLYFWAHVWACEGRMTSEEADRIFHDHEHTPALAPLRLIPS